MRPLAPILLIVLTCALTLAAVPACAQWRPLGLSGKQVARLRTHAGFLYACTDLGLFRLATDSPDTLWSAAGFEGQDVLDLAVIGPQALLAARLLSGATDTVSLHRSLDGGTSWVPFQNGFGAGSSRQARKLLATGSGTLFAASSRIERSLDAGLSWQVVQQAQIVNALEGSPANPDLVWAGGETVIFQPYLLKSSDSGDTWKTINLSAGGDNAVDAIAAHPFDPDVVYLGMEGRVMKSEDGGTQWTTTTSPDPMLYTFGMAIRPFLPLKIYAAGASFAPDPRGVVFYQSEDAGLSWLALAYPADAGYGARNLLLTTGAVEETLYVATYNGVFRHTQGTVGVPDQPRDAITLRCRPNPFTATTVIEFWLPTLERATLRILDLQGRTVAVPWDGFAGPGPHRAQIDGRSLPAGVYFADLSTGAGNATLRLLHLR